MHDTDVLNALSERVKQLEDLEEIRQLYIDYGRHLDAGDADAYAALFARDGKLRLGPVMHANGREEIKQAAANTIGRTPEGSNKSVHLLASPRVDINGDTASGECVWAAIAPSRDGASQVLVGRHVDELIREDGHWRFARRRGYVDVGSISS
jgi:uncharacterized protein (TIGR02246 family)